MNKDLEKRFNSAVCDMNNFCTDECEFLEPIKLEGDFEILSVKLTGEYEVIVTPKRSIWDGAYESHKFIFSLEDMSDAIITQICEELENGVRALAAWWDSE